GHLLVRPGQHERARGAAECRCVMPEHRAECVVLVETEAAPEFAGREPLEAEQVAEQRIGDEIPIDVRAAAHGRGAGETDHRQGRNATIGEGRARVEMDLSCRQTIARRDRLKPQRSEEHTSELQSLAYLVCRLLLEKKKTNK